MNRGRDGLGRYIFIGGMFLVFCAFYVAMFINLQVSGQDYYSMASKTTEASRTVKLQADRGEILDRNGKTLVGNKYSYDLQLDYGSFSGTNKEKNGMLLALVSAIRENDGEDGILPPNYTPIKSNVSEGIITFSYDDDFFELTRANKYKKITKEMNLNENASADEAARAFMKRYGLADGDGTLVCSVADAAFLLDYRLDMELMDFSPENPYTLAKDVAFEMISSLGETGLRGYTARRTLERVYNYPGYASHILGRINKIPSEQTKYYSDLGYPLDAVVGVDGAEYAFEEYLHGSDGELTIFEDKYGNIVRTEVTKEPVAGQDVWLTIDIEMQITAEDALHEGVEFVRSKAETLGERRGEDAEAAALTAVDPDTGEVLTLASYPTYSLASFSDDYKYISSDESAPLLNRALSGQYEPGSTFKPGVALAALNENLITEWTEIEDKGVYTYYDSYKPQCWIHLLYGLNHGFVNVTKAIQDSCNYFFFDIGRRLTIETIDEYAKGYGYGEPTGIELGEKTGVLASPNYKNENGLGIWNPGETLQAAIGQSYNLFSPLQMSMAMSTIINRGDRYGAHILYKVTSYEGDVTFENEPKLLSSMNISDNACAVVLNAMKNVIEDGSVSAMFNDYSIEIGGKTGTAQVSEHKSDNAIFTAFAPFDSPELAVACVIEQGDTGANAGLPIKKVFDYYFNVDANGDDSGGSVDGADGQPNSDEE